MDHISLKNINTQNRWHHLEHPASALALTKLYEFCDSPILFITPDLQSAYTLKDAFGFFAKQSLQNAITIFPDWEMLPYDQISPHRDIISERLAILNQIHKGQKQIVIIAASTLLHRLAPLSHVIGGSFQLKISDTFDIEKERTQLTKTGYQHVQQVMEHGEFSIRGGIIDIFPMGSKTPIRVECFDDEIESIRTFDVDSQLTQHKVETISLMPAHEYDLSEAHIDIFRQKWRQHFQSNPKNCQIFQSISKGIAPAGIEYYLPLFFNESASFFDYLPQESIVVYGQAIWQAMDAFTLTAKHRYEQYQGDYTRSLLPPKDMLLKREDISPLMRPFKQICIEPSAKSQSIDFKTHPIHQKGVVDIKSPFNAFIELFNDALPTLIVAETLGRKNMLETQLASMGVQAEDAPFWQDFAEKKPQLAITSGFLSKGFEALDDFRIITEAELFGHKPSAIHRRKRKAIDHEKIIKSLVELTIDAPVVHADHGIGLYKGLTTLETQGEFLVLSYAGNDKVYVPVTHLHLINRYTQQGDGNVALSKLGSEQWRRAKDKAQKQIHDTAVSLLEIYAKRQAKPGFTMKINPESMAYFESQFPFEETPDQQKAIRAITEDMKGPQPMDRLVCGDVGFGKTEVAMRAAFIAIENQKQVVILVPTTLLAMQHYQNFVDRFAGLKVNIKSLTRFQSSKEIAESGEVDILIGTHKLITKPIAFKSLGLVIIDEEHRFGVRQKEYLKSLRTTVDILTLTATPIPRTLNLALTGMRDISIIATPPAKRLAVKTFIMQHNPVIVKEAITRELMRGGQVFYLHNNVKSIERTFQQLQSLIPNANMAIAHGQMRERELESIMNDFYHQRFQVLVCTTIIETGIDIPTANTIIIDRADRFGIAQLHQLRGRVGRSHHQAYAYLLTPPKETLTKDASKRLEAIESLDELGSGFMLSTHDLEIRGAGEILGDEQSGSIQAIGYSLYMELLERAIISLKDEKEPSISHPCDVHLQIPALIPDDYIADVQTRLTLYKRIAGTKDAKELDDLKVEMIDRFGLLPDEVKTYFLITQIKQACERIGIIQLTLNKDNGRIDFSKDTCIEPADIIRLIQLFPKRYRLVHESRLRIEEPMPTLEDKLKAVKHLWQHLTQQDLELHL